MMRLLIDEDTAVQLIEPLRHVLFGHLTGRNGVCPGTSPSGLVAGRARVIAE